MYIEQPSWLEKEELVALQRAAAGLDIAPGPGGSQIVPAPSLAPFISRLFTSPTRISAVALWPSSQIVAHADPPLPSTRFHIPLILNDACWVFHAGTWQQLSAGHLYLMDQTQVHGAVNWGATRRTHLIVDQE